LLEFRYRPPGGLLEKKEYARREDAAGNEASHIASTKVVNVDPALAGEE